MDPTLVPIPRRVRLRRGRFSGPLLLGWLLQAVMLAALYEVVRPLWWTFCFCTKGHSLTSVPTPPWEPWLGVASKTPISAVQQIVVAGLLFFVVRALADFLVWKGKREKDLLVKGRAMLATVTKVRSERGKHWITYSQTRDGKQHENELQVKEPKTVGAEVIVLFSFDYVHEMLYEQCRYELA
jgi:hypothetical protein